MEEWIVQGLEHMDAWLAEQWQQQVDMDTIIKQGRRQGGLTITIHGWYKWKLANGHPQKYKYMGYYGMILDELQYRMEKAMGEKAARKMVLEERDACKERLKKAMTS